MEPGSIEYVYFAIMASGSCACNKQQSLIGLLTIVLHQLNIYKFAVSADLGLGLFLVVGVGQSTFATAARHP